jgi:hypothetical protein
MRRPLVIYDFATAPFLNFLVYEENLIFIFISVKVVSKMFTVFLNPGNLVFLIQKREKLTTGKY